MEAITKWNKWANAHTNIGLDALRIALGAFLFYKGIYFIDQSEYLLQVLSPINQDEAAMFLAHYVAPAHLVGGLFVVLGFLTRLSCLLQLPILVGAVLVNFIGAFEAIEFTQSFVALILCSGFVFYGSGKHSVDYNMQLQV